MNKFVPCLAAAGLMGLAPAVMANQNDTQENRFYVAPMASYNFAGNNETDPDGNLGGQLSLGKNFGNFLALEMYGFYYGDIDNNDGTTDHTDIGGYGVSTLFFPARDILPVYAVVGAGIGQNGYSDGYGHGHSKFYDFGAGYMFPLNDYGVKLRAEYRYRHTRVNNPIDGVVGGGDHIYNHDNVVSVGLQIPLGAKEEAKAEPKPEPAPEPADTDGDGVIDADDLCPGTPSNVEVDADGCPIEKAEPVVLHGVTFKFDSADLTNQASGRLNNVTSALEASPKVKFSIDGYTDSTGPADYNQKLSEQRAHSVADYLVGQGINDDRITAITGHGEANPVASNDTKEGRAENRRVELNVTNQ